MMENDGAGGQVYYHGTRADLAEGDHIGPGFASNYGKRREAAWVYLTATLDAAIWGAELAQGDGPERVYLVMPTGPIFDDPNLTDQKFPGNPTRSYRSRDQLLVTGEVLVWQGHSPEQIAEMKANLAALTRAGSKQSTETGDGPVRRRKGSRTRRQTAVL